MHVAYALGLLHRLLVSIRYADGSETTSVLNIRGVRALRIIDFLGVSGCFE